MGFELNAAEHIAGLDMHVRAVQQRVRVVVDDTTENGARGAKGFAPVGDGPDAGRLRAGIRAVTGEGTDTEPTGRVVVDVPYAPYPEFGTGPFVSVPTGLEEYAREFYVNGKGTSKPQPYLFPAIEAQRAPFYRSLATAVESR